jgi:Holliday junction resolvase RusA-like endonuclease
VRVVTFTVPGQPVAKGRARISTFGGHVRSYTPEKTRRYENQVSAYAAEAMRNMPLLGGPVEVVVQAFMMVPASWSLKKRLSAIAGQIKPTTKPDLDNIVKALDGMNGIVVVDDSQIVKLTATKQYSEIPQLIVSVIGQE